MPYVEFKEQNNTFKFLRELNETPGFAAELLDLVMPFVKKKSPKKDLKRGGGEACEELERV